MFTCRDGRATGVEYKWNTSSGSGDTTSSYIVRASKMVVVAGGAFGSPAILERSGIGSAAVLSRAGVTQIVDLKGVGESYQGMLLRFYITTYQSGIDQYLVDHNIVFVPYNADPDTESLDAIMRGEADEISCETLRLLRARCMLIVVQRRPSNGPRPVKAAWRLSIFFCSIRSFP